MPKIYLSPSTQEKNLYINGGTEEEYMNIVADALEPYLISNGIRFNRNTPQMTASSSVAQSNEGHYDLHLSLHSNAASEERSGLVQGSIVFYSPNNNKSEEAADIFAENFKAIYPDPNLVTTRATTSLIEVAKTKAPGILFELAFHDNEEDANFIKDNIEAIARNLALSLTEYFEIPFTEPIEPMEGKVAISGGNLNIRRKPDISSMIVGKIPRNATLTIVGELPNWYVVNYAGDVGYASKDFIEVI